MGNIDDNRDMMRRTNLVLNFKRLSLNINTLFVHLKASKTKIDKLFDSDEISCSHILTISVSNWLKENTQVTDAIKVILDKCQNLKTINFDYLVHRVDEIVEHIACNLPDLINLYLNNCYPVTDKGLNALKECSKLKKLSLFRCHKISDSSLEILAIKCKDLETLDITLCRNITDLGIKKISQSCSQLKSIILKGLDISDNAIDSLALKCKFLESLDLTNCRQLTDNSLKFLSLNAEQLRELKIEECFKVTDFGISGYQIVIT